MGDFSGNLILICGPRLLTRLLCSLGAGRGGGGARYNLTLTSARGRGKGSFFARESNLQESIDERWRA
jgi:hypothetical protein